MMQLRALLFAVCILTIVVPIRAATYYVDAERGNDTNSGTSATAAWKTLSRVNQEKFRPGDAVLFRRGQIWREQLNFQASGEAERAITIDAYGEGTLPEISGADLAPAEGWTACQSCGANIWQAGITTQPNVVLFDGTKGIKRAAPGDVKSPGDWNWTAGTLYIYAESDPRRLFLKRGVEVGVRPIGINLTGLAYITIRNVRVSAANAAPYALGANIWGIAVGRKGPSPRGLRIERNEIVNSAGDGLHLEGVQESTVDANLVANNENVGIQIYRSLEAFPVSDVTVSNNIVRYNLVRDNGSNGLMTDYMPTQGNRFVYNMVFNHPNGSCIFANNKGHVFANNTCVNNRDGIYLYVSKTTPETGEITVKNNIIVNSQKYHMVVERGVQGPISFDNNEYFPDDGMKFDWKDSPSNFDAWRGKSGGDAATLFAGPLLPFPKPPKNQGFAVRSGPPDN